MQPTPAVPPTSTHSFQQQAQRQRQANRGQYQEQQQQQQQAPAAGFTTPVKPAISSPRTLVKQEHAATTNSPRATAPPPPTTAGGHSMSPPRGGPVPVAPPPHTPPSSSSLAGFGAGAAPRGRPRLYQNEEVILFRTPSDASHLILFNLPSRPFIHAFYDLKTVAKARAEANEAMLKEKEASSMKDIATTTEATASALLAAAPSNPAAAPATASATPRPYPPRPATTTAVGAAPATPTAASLCATYHALHLLNVERVLHAISKKYGLVHELSLQCKPRESSEGMGGGLSGQKRRRSLYPMAFDDEEDDADNSCAAIEAFEAGFSMWAFIKYYSLLHAAHAHKELNRTTLVPGKRIKAKMVQRNTPQSPIKPPNPDGTAAAASSTGAGASSAAGVVTPRSWYPLAHHRCLEVCNYFLGFNNWNCSIQRVRRYHHEQDQHLMDGRHTNTHSAVQRSAGKSSVAHWLSCVWCGRRFSARQQHVPRVCSGEVCKLVRAACTHTFAPAFALAASPPCVVVAHAFAAFVFVVACASVGLRLFWWRSRVKAFAVVESATQVSEPSSDTSRAASADAGM